MFSLPVRSWGNPVPTLRRDARDGGLPRAVGSNETARLSCLDRKGYVPQRPDVVALGSFPVFVRAPSDCPAAPSDRSHGRPRDRIPEGLVRLALAYSVWLA